MKRFQVYFFFTALPGTVAYIQIQTLDFIGNNSKEAWQCLLKEQGFWTDERTWITSNAVLMIREIK